MAFQDHFSQQARDYARHRPTYPAELYGFLGESCPDTRLAVDVGTGNGQAAAGLAAYFERVIAVEPSAEQLSLATPTPRVTYAQAPAESLPVPDGVAGLITAGQAAHWFELDEFYREVRRVGAPEARLAIWGYERTQISPVIDGIVDNFYGKVVGQFWPPQRSLIENGYRDLGFPFRKMTTPSFWIERAWTADAFLGYVASWSAVARMRVSTGTDPLPLLQKALATAWTDTELVRWPIPLLFGAVHLPLDL